MSRELFNLARQKVNASPTVGTIWLEAGPMIDNVFCLEVAKKTPNLAFAEYDSSHGRERFYFQIKDLIGFSLDNDGSEEYEDSSKEDEF